MNLRRLASYEPPNSHHPGASFEILRDCPASQIDAKYANCIYYKFK